MRISNQQMLDDALRSLQINQERLSRSAERATSGIAVARPSDDPVAYSRAADYQARLTRLDGYDQNAALVRAQLSATDGTLQSIQDVLARLRELALAAQGPIADRTLNAAEATTLREQLQQLMNRSLNGVYLFAGYASSAPFTNHVFTGDNQRRAVEVSPLGATAFGLTAQDAFGVAPGQVVFPGIDALIAAMRNGDSAGINAGLGAVDGYQKQVAQAQTRLGSQINGLDLAQSGNQAYRLSLTRALSEERDADPAAAYSILAADRATVEATYAVLGAQRGLSLVKYL